jgi:hypothetical protein
MAMNRQLLRMTRVSVMVGGAAVLYQAAPLQEAYASCSSCKNYAVCEGFKNDGYSSCWSDPTCHNSDVPCPPLAD